MAYSLKSNIDALVHQATNQTLELVLRDGCPVVIVDSPPGAGKTLLVETVAAVAVRYKLKVGVIAPRIQQTYDLLQRLIKDFEPLPIQLLKANDADLPPSLIGHPRLLPPVSHAHQLNSGPSVVVGTAAKFLASVQAFADRYFDLLICDESYQLAYKDIAPLFRILGQALFVGDPGQLDPLILADTARFESARYKVHWPVPKEMLRRFPEIPIVRLPASRRLLQDTVTLLQPNFYPTLPFVSAVDQAQRQIKLRSLGMNTPIDQLLNMLSGGASIVGILLPALEFPLSEVDLELSDLIKSIVLRFSARGAEWEGVRPLSSADIGCVDSHVASGASTTQALRSNGISTDDLLVTTPEVWQGSQRPLMIIKSPLSSKSRLSSFELHPGRLCVMLSRHELGCIIVGRDGYMDSLERHQHDCAERLMGTDDMEWIGWQAHYKIWSELERMGRVVRL